MTVFKTFLKVLKACKVPIIIYTVILIFFGAFNMQSSDNSTNFVASKPDIYIVNNDQEIGITKGLIDYLKENTNIIELKDNEDAINDALFYRDVNCIIYIPRNFRIDFLNNKNPSVDVKSTGDYQASLAQMLLERYLNTANIYNNSLDDEDVIVLKVKETLTAKTEIELTSKLDTDNLARVAFYYNFLSYSLLAGCIYVICLVLSSFKNKNISRRTIISSMNYKEYNRKLLLSNSLFAIVLWMLYVILSFILLGNIMFTTHGLIYIINSFIFTLCALAVAFLIGNLVNNKDTINGIVNVVVIGSSFLCGVFVPMEWLPDSVLTIAHVLPTYWFVKSNELLKTIEVFNFETLKPILINMLFIVGFIITFIIINNIIVSKKRKMD